MTHILHINDNNLLIQSESKVARSQGYAWLKGDEVIFDSDSSNSAVRHCRLAPQEINSRYWQQCEQTSIVSNGAGMRHAADLIWKHLSELKTSFDLDKVILVVPSHYQSSNLQLLLGIANACGLEVQGLLNKAALAISHIEVNQGRFLHVDVQLHQTVTSEVEIQAGLAKLGAVEVIQGVGIQVMQDTLLKAMQSHFINNDRFDPLHYAETEQQLFDQLGEAAAQIVNAGKASVAVQHQTQLHSTSMDKKIWVQSLNSVLEPLVLLGRSTDHAYLDMNAAFASDAPSDLHGPDLSVITQVAPFSKIAAIARESIDKADGPTIVYKTELHVGPVETADAEHATDAVAHGRSFKDSVPTGATHLMQAGIAVAIEHSEIQTDTNELVLQTSAQGNAEAFLASGKLYVMNDESRKSLKPNDRLGSHFAEGVITVIQVV